MKFSLFPKEKVFYELLEKLADQAKEAMQVFKLLTMSWSPSHPGIQKINDIEHSCDEVVHEIMVKLNKTFITPIDREDIHLLAKRIDDLVDIIQALTKRMVLFQIEAVTDDLKEMTMILETSIGLVVKIVHQIRDLKNANEIFESCIQIHTLENQGDRFFEKTLGELFQNKGDPLEVIKWKDIYYFLELAIDKCEGISDVIWGIVVKYG